MIILEHQPQDTQNEGGGNTPRTDWPRGMTTPVAAMPTVVPTVVAMPVSFGGIFTVAHRVWTHALGRDKCMNYSVALRLCR